MSRVTTAWYKLFGLILVVAAVLKAWDPAAIVPTLQYFGVPRSLLSYFVLIAMGVEAFVGTMLLVSCRPVLLRTSTWALLVGFTAVTLVMFLRPAAPPCGCLGRVGASLTPQQQHGLALGRNVALMLTGVGCLLWDRWRVNREAAAEASA
jgi:hypothetical protein